MVLGMAKSAHLPNLTTLSYFEKDVLIVTRHAQVIEAFAGQSVRKDSHNSSVPPSIDALNKKKTRSYSGNNSVGKVRPTAQLSN